MAQGHRLKSEWPSEALSDARRPHSGRFGRCQKVMGGSNAMRSICIESNVQLAGPGLLQTNVGAPSRRRTIKFEFDLDIVRSLGQSSETL